NMLNRVFTALLTALVACALISCSTTPRTDASGQSKSISAAKGPSAQKLLAQAQTAASPLREQLILQAVERLIFDENFQRARNLLGDLDSARLNEELYIKHTDLLSDVAIRDGSYFLAQDILTTERL